MCAGHWARCFSENLHRRFKIRTGQELNWLPGAEYEPAIHSIYSQRCHRRLWPLHQSLSVGEALKITVAFQRADIPALSSQAVAIVTVANFGSNLFAGGNRVAPRSDPWTDTAKAVTELIKHHKVAAARSQPWRDGRIEAVSGGRKELDFDQYLELMRRLC